MPTFKYSAWRNLHLKQNLELVSQMQLVSYACWNVLILNLMKTKPKIQVDPQVGAHFKEQMAAEKTKGQESSS